MRMELEPSSVSRGAPQEAVGATACPHAHPRSPNGAPHRQHGLTKAAALCRYLVHTRGSPASPSDPGADNIAAIRCYQHVGFRPLGSCANTNATRRHLARRVLMDLLAADLHDNKPS